MADGSGLTNFAKKYPKRFFDVGIAEQHALNICCWPMHLIKLNL